MNANLSALTATAQCEIINTRLDCLLIMNKGVDSLFSLVPSLQTRKHLVYIENTACMQVLARLYPAQFCCYVMTTHSTVSKKANNQRMSLNGDAEAGDRARNKEGLQIRRGA